MSDLELARVDPDDHAAVDAWHAASVLASEFGREATAATFQLEEARPMLQERSPTRSLTAYVGRVAGEVVAAALVELPLQDNRELADLSLGVVPEARRRGHGSRVLAELEAVLTEQGRTRLTAEVSWPVGGAADGRGAPGVEFALRHGYALGLVEVQRELALPVPPALLERLAAEAAPHHAAYTLRSWVGAVPEDLLHDWVTLEASLTTEAPLGDLEREPGAVDVEAQRIAETRIAAQGRTTYSTVALDAVGTVVAYTDLATTIHESGRAYQWGTLVRRADRGHRLGLALKAVNLAQMQNQRPDLVRLSTWNAANNPQMVSINDALGFRPVEYLGAFQRR